MYKGKAEKMIDSFIYLFFKLNFKHKNQAYSPLFIYLFCQTGG